MHYLKKLKIILLFSILIIRIPFCFNQNSRYTNEQTIIGIIQTIKIDGNQLQMEVLGKEKIIMNYYFKSEDEKDYYSQALKMGYKIKANGELIKPSHNRNFALFNYRNYLKSKKIYWIFSAYEFSFTENNNIFFNIKNQLFERANRSKNKDYLKTLILGQNSLEEEVKKSYYSNGISHLFAISGMHITLLTTILFSFFNLITKKKKLNFLIISLILLFYIFLTNYSPSVIRASLLFMALNIKSIFHLKVTNFQIVFLLLLLFLNYNPYYLYNIGFLYSFIISMGIIYYNKNLKDDNYIKSVFKISIFAFLLGLPITIKNFHEINLLTPFINVIFVPIISFVIFPFSILNFLFPVIDPIYAYILNLLEIISLQFSKLMIPIILKEIPIFLIIVYYVIIFLILKKVTIKKIIIFLFIILIHSNINFLSDDFIVTIIDVGQGDSTLISFPHNQGNILIDTGGIVSFEEASWKKKNKQYSIAESTIIPYLKSMGIHKLDYLIISHGDFDHMGEAINLVEHFKVDRVILNCGEYNNLEQEFIAILIQKNIKYYSCLEELNVKNYRLHFLNTKQYDNENDNSNVFYLTLYNYKFLFMGDASVKKEKDILEKYNLKNIDFLKVGHHGSKTSSSKEFIDEIKPKYSIISVGKNNRYGHPNKEVLSNLENSKIYRTDKNGGIEIKLNKKNYKIRTCLSEE